MTDELISETEPDPAELLAEALASYDKALSSGDAAAISIAMAEVSRLRSLTEGHQLEPAMEFNMADAQESLYAHAPPLEKAVLDGEKRLILLRSGFTITGRVTDLTKVAFTVLTDNGLLDSGPHEWTVASIEVAAIARAKPAE